jgi:hypothetical protein
MPYDFIDQNIVASCLIQSHTDDSFYNPVANSHTGYAFDGNYYSLGSIVNGHQQASWFTEYGTNPFRGDKAAFPSYGLVLLSPVSLVILDQTKSVTQATALPLWMQFILADNNALANNFNFSLQGFLPQSVCYADGIVSVTYSPDAGNFGFQFFNISATSIASNILTVTTEVNDLQAYAALIAPLQVYVMLSGTAEPFLNQQIFAVTPTSTTQFTANLTGVNYSNPTDTGVARLLLLPPYPAPYPSVANQSHMVVSIDFGQDSVYLDVGA